MNVTNDIIVVEAELAGLAGFENLHSDELDLGFAVLKHLLCGCKQFSVLQGQRKIKSCKNKYRLYVVMGNSLYAKLSFDYLFKSVFFTSLYLINLCKIFNTGHTLVQDSQRLNMFQGLLPCQECVSRKGLRLQVISWLTSTLANFP